MINRLIDNEHSRSLQYRVCSSESFLPTVPQMIVFLWLSDRNLTVNEHF